MLNLCRAEAEFVKRKAAREQPATRGRRRGRGEPECTHRFSSRLAAESCDGDDFLIQFKLQNLHCPLPFADPDATVGQSTTATSLSAGQVTAFAAGGDGRRAPLAP